MFYDFSDTYSVYVDGIDTSIKYDYIYRFYRHKKAMCRWHHPKTQAQGSRRDEKNKFSYRIRCDVATFCYFRNSSDLAV